MTDRDEAKTLRPRCTGDAPPDRREPHLDELLDDPIMALLWRGDRLEPCSARVTVLGLREILRRRHAAPEPMEA